jgi:hypothetical protein
MTKIVHFPGLHELPAEVDDGLEHRQRPGFNLKKKTLLKIRKISQSACPWLVIAD